MANTAKNFINQAESWLGCKESDGSHRKIIDAYNTQRPLPRGYAVKYTDSWCAAFVSAVAVKTNCTDIVPPECSCPKMIGLFQNKGCWNENDNRVPNPGDIIFYDWSDTGNGDNHGSADHVGIVTKVVGNEITVIEGNYHDSVAYRHINVGGRYIRGYGIPKFNEEIAPQPPEPITEDDEMYTLDLFVRDIQNVTGCNVDGCAGNQTIRNTPTISKYRNSTSKAVLPVQKRLKALGFYSGTLDGKAENRFDEAVKAFQKSINNPYIDGELTSGQNTWKHLLGMI